MAPVACLLATLVLLTMVMPAAQATPIGTTPHISLAGHYNYVVTGGSLRTQNNATDPCALISGNSGTSVDAGTSTASISGIPVGATIVGAYLYFIGDGGTADYTVTFNGTSVPANPQYSDVLNFASANGGNADYKYFGGFVNVTSYVSGNGSYSFGGLSVQNVDDPGFGEPTYCTYWGVVAGWALVVVYEDASEPLRVINIFDGLQKFYGSSITLSPSNFKIPASPINGKMTVISWGGDADISGALSGLNEEIGFNGITQTIPVYAPTNNQFNATISSLGVTTSWGVDIDTYDISSLLAAGDTGATTFYSTGQDDDYLTAQVISVTNTPVADLAITKTLSGTLTQGSNGIYQITVHNNGPEVAAGTITVSDTLPAGLSYVSAAGSGWSCSFSSPTVTCTTTSSIANGASAPYITLTVAVASDAPASISNTASVSNDTEFDNVSSNNSSTKTASVTRSDLSTSTKTVLDPNGGDAEPGDVLEYTITLTETAGVAASNVSVTDDMPLNVGSLTVTNNAGCTDASTTTGGANGTGYLDITCSSVAANTSKTIVFEVTIDAGTAAGTTIDNTATVTNPNGTGASAVAPTITVSQSAVPASGNKILYVYDDQSLTRTPQTTSGSYVLVPSNGGTKDWTLTPVLAKALTINAGSTISVNLLVQCDNKNGSGNCRSASSLKFTAALYDKNGASMTQIGSTSSPASSFNETSFTSTNNPVTANISVGGSAVTVPVGHQLVLRITNTTGRNNRGMQVEQYASGKQSTVSLDLSTVIAVDSVGTYSDANCSTPATLEYHAGSTVHLCAVVSDPFGSYDIAPATGGTLPTITITDPTPTQQVIASMTQVADSGAATKTFVYTYTVPAAPVTGTWAVAVTAWEGTENTVNRSGSGSFDVAPPSPDLSTSTKAVVDLNGGDAEPGDVLEYTITLIETVGQPATNVSVTDNIPANVGGVTVVNNAGGTVNSTDPVLDISGITVPAGGSKTIVFDVTIDAGTAAGTDIDNTATVTNPDGNGATAVAPTVTVSQSQVPASGNKLLYVYTSNNSLTRTPQTGTGGNVTISQGNSHDWTLTTTLAKDLTIQANSTLSVTLLVECVDLNGSGNCRNGGNLHFTAELYDNTVSAGTQIGSTSPDASFNHTSYTQETANITIGGSDVTIVAGHQLILRITNSSSSNRDMRIEQYDSGNLSTVTLDVSTVINVDSVGTYTDNTCATAASTSAVYATNGTVFICTVVSDPFGAADINPTTGGTAPTITITDAGSTQQVNAASMSHVSGADTTSTKTFSYTYNVPISPPATLALGGWTATVTAWEGTEHNVSDSGNGSFEVGAPNLVILKAITAISGPVHGTTKPHALPGATMRYSVIITNQGKGAVDNNALVITNPIPANTTFVVGSITGSGSGSGLSPLTAGDIEFSDDGGSTWAPNPGATVTDIKISPDGSMLGKTGATTPTYTVTFDVTIN